MRRIFYHQRSFAVLTLAFTLGACGIDEGSLSHSQASADDLARAVVAALEAEDTTALEELWVTEAEYRTLLWDELPESQHLEFEFVWDLNRRNSRDGMSRALSRFGGEDFEFLRIEFTEEPEVYETFTLHRGTELWVRRVSDGEEGVLPVLDVVLERDGRWKLMNYDE